MPRVVELQMLLLKWGPRSAWYGYSTAAMEVKEWTPFVIIIMVPET
jgi:hypothetical protein